MKNLISRAHYLLLMVLTVAMIGCANTPESKTAGEVVDDAAITAAVKAKLLADKEVSGSSVQVETFKGVVQLSGFVKSDAEARRAVEIAQTVKGVKSVKNDMRLK